MKKSNKVTILWEDEDLLVAVKPFGMPTRPDKSGDPSLQAHLEQTTGAPLFVLHHLDRPAAGLIAFARSGAVAGRLSAQLQQGKWQKTYLAFVEKNCALSPRGRLTHRLVRDGAVNKSFVRDDGKISKLEYEVLKEFDHYMLLRIHLLSGRHHQIRAQFGAIGCPVKGDWKYGAKRGNRDRSIHLLAHTLTIPGYPLLQAPIPTDDPLWALAAPTLEH